MVLLHILFAAHDGVGFSTASLPVGKDRAIISVENVLDYRECALLVYFFLGGVLIEDLGEGKYSNMIISCGEDALFVLRFIKRDEIIVVIDGDECFDFWMSIIVPSLERGLGRITTFIRCDILIK